MHCKSFSIVQISEVLKKDNTSKLWDKLKENWNINDWEEFFKLKNK